MTSQKTLKALVGRYLAHPDPLDWLAAADHLEESGNDREARRWRRRGEWYPGVREAFDAARMSVGETRCTFLSPCGHARIAFIMKRKTVAVETAIGHTVKRPGGLINLYGVHTDRRFAQRLLWLIDELGAILDARGD